MKLIGQMIGFAVKLTVLAAAVVVVLELIDRMAEKNRFRYMISEEFGE
ncbi:MAG: hypothetical protein RR022_04720 [Angelakisella sp.]